MANRKTYAQHRAEVEKRYPSGQAPGGVGIDDIVQLRMQNTYDTHLDIARDMATVMRADMAAYDADPSKFTQSLGCWSGFHAQQMIKAVKRMRGTAKGTYVYLSGWMVAGLRNRWGHLPDQSMHEKTAVADLIHEIYVSLRQADEVAINDLFKELKAAKTDADRAKIIEKIDNFETHVVPIIADIDARRHPLHIAIENFGNDANIGAVVRTANAFAVDTVHIVGRRRWNRRGAMVTDRYQHLMHHDTTEDLLGHAAAAGLTVVAVDNVPGAVRLEDTTLPRECLLVFGQEGPGVSPAAATGAAFTVSIAQFGSTRSINAAVAAGIAMHSWIRRWADLSRAW